MGGVCHYVLTTIMLSTCPSDLVRYVIPEIDEVLEKEDFECSCRMLLMNVYDVYILICAKDTKDKLDVVLVLKRFISRKIWIYLCKPQ